MGRNGFFVLCLLVLLSSILYVKFNSVAERSSNGGGSVHNITSGQNYTSIQEAIDNANYEDVIVVDAGTYNEDVKVTQTVSLIGKDRYNTIINGSGGYHVIDVCRSGSKVTNFTIQNNNKFSFSGVFVRDYGSNVSYNIIRNCSNGVSLDTNSINNYVVDNEIWNCTTGVRAYYTYVNYIIGNNISFCSSEAVLAEGSWDVVIQRNTISNSYRGIYLVYLSQRTIISDNNITNCRGGIGLEPSYLNNITNNRIVSCEFSGIYLGSYLGSGSSGNVLSGNIMMDNLYSFWVEGETLYDFINFIDTSNTVDGKPVYYWVSQQDAVVPLDAGYVGLVNSTRITAQNLSLSNNGQGILLAFTSDSTITGNNISNNYYGLHVWNSSNYNTVYNNNLESNEYGVWLGFSSNNTFYHNNFTNNVEQVYIDSYGYANFWNETYPIGGNYWSNFKNRYPDAEDTQKGPHQNQTGSDGFWDNPYIIDENNQDNYPIVPEFPAFMLLPLFMIATLLVVIVQNKKG